LKDIFGTDINIHDYIVYGGRRGSKQTINFAVVLSLSTEEYQPRPLLIRTVEPWGKNTFVIRYQTYISKQQAWVINPKLLPKKLVQKLDEAAAMYKAVQGPKRVKSEQEKREDRMRFNPSVTRTLYRQIQEDLRGV
jgi:hypothetical protein